MSQVRAKFECVRIDEEKGWEQKVVSFDPVMDGSEENKSFAKYTPGGSVQLIISDDTQATNFFEKGKAYYVDFTPAEN